MNSIIVADQLIFSTFNDFIDRELQNIIDDNREVEPTIIPPNVDDYKICLNKVWVGKPEIISMCLGLFQRPICRRIHKYLELVI